jgi:5-methylcytosine-specific restriction endonuclease McrA
MCAQLGRTTAATVVDHVIPHRGDIGLFWKGALASSCKPCHDGAKQQYELTGKLRGCDVDGYPLDPLFKG